MDASNIERSPGAEYVGEYMKVTSTGRGFLCRLHSDGTLTERNVFETQETWNGTWRTVVDDNGEHLELQIGDNQSYLLLFSGLWVGPESFEDSGYIADICMAKIAS